MKLCRRIIALGLTALLLGGCTTANTVIPPETAPNATVEDIFQVPGTTAPNSTPQTGSTTPTENTAPPLPGGGSFGGSLSAGPKQTLQDEKGAYTTYEGGEMEIPFQISATGSVRQKGIGILLFIDGQPQPYRTEDGNYAYMHVFSVPQSGILETVFRFVPITGNHGDELELYSLSLLDPLRALSENGQGPSITSAPSSGFRLKYNASPVASPETEKDLRLSGVSCSFVNTTYNEVGSWTDRDLLERNESHLFVNGIPDSRSCIVYGVSADAAVTLRFELWGSPYVHYGVVFFVDNRPVFPEDGAPFFVEVRNGQKTVLEATLSMAEFDGECPVYAVLVPRNYRTSEVLTVCSIEGSRVFFLTAEENPQ